MNSGNIHEVDEKTIALAKTLMAKDAKKDLSLMDMVRYAQSLIKLKRNGQY
jgi:hypothetical protein